MPNPVNQLNEMAARLKAFGVIMRLGHDLFNAPDFETAAAMAVNNARPVVGFRSSTLIRVQDRKAEIVSQYAQVAVNRHSRLAVLQRDLIELAGPVDDVLEISAENAEKYGDGLAVQELCRGNVSLLLIPLKPPVFLGNTVLKFIWMLEFEGKPPAYAVTAARLLASSYSEALYCQRIGGSRVRAFRSRRFINFKRIFWMALLLAAVLVMFVRIPEKVNAEFELKAPEIATVYAWFDGPVADCFKKNGDWVREGETVARYDTSQLEFRLSAARSAVRETEAELKLKENASFTDKEHLGEVKLLEAKLESARVAVAEAEWYLAHAELKAPRTGTLHLADERPEALAGKAVRTGDKIFEVLGGKGMDVKVPVNESDSSILLKEPEMITLFPHTSPDKPVRARVREISPAPELTEQRTYCYNLIAELPEEAARGFRYGMRGIAKIKGEDVSIGYFLFKSVILYFRRL